MRISAQYTAVLLTLWLLVPAWSADLPTWDTGGGTRTVENGTVLENDLLFQKGNGQRGPRAWPQASVVQCGPISGAAPGRYRASFRARIAQWGSSNLVLQAWVRQEDGGAGTGAGYDWRPVPVASTSMSGFMFTHPGQWQRFALEFNVAPGNPTMVGIMYVGDKTPPPAGAVQIEQASLKLDKLDVPVSIAWSRPVKLRYHHDEHPALDFRLINFTDHAQEVAVRPVIVDDQERRSPATATTMTVPPLATISGQAPFPVPAEGGYQADVELLNGGKIIDRHDGDVFCVSDSPFLFMMTDPVGSGHLAPNLLSGSGKLPEYTDKVLTHWDAYVAACKQSVETWRSQYATYHEYFAWAREDATLLTEDSDAPYLSGQTSYSVSRKQLRLLNDLMRSHGMAPVAYTNAVPFGWPAFEVIRRYPEWYGGSANFDTKGLENYQQQVQPGGAYCSISMNFEAVSPGYGKRFLDYHIDQLTASAKQYGWEGYRYDAAALPIKYFPVVQKTLIGLNPPVYIGNNQGVACLGAQQSEEWKVYCAHGALMMEEAMRGGKDPHSPIHNWTDWIGLLSQGARLTRANGGHYTYISDNRSWYASTLGYAVGGHPYGFGKSPFGDNERFMLHYGYAFWDLRTQQLPDPDKTLSVTGSRPVWWKPLVSQRRLDAQHRLVIVPLFNPPAEAEVTGSSPVAPAEDVVVSFTPDAGEHVTARLLAAEPTAHSAPLALTQRGNTLQVQTPQFWSWTTVLFDCVK